MLRTIPLAIVMAVLTACGPGPSSGTAVSCDTDAECGAELICAALVDDDSGVTNTVCVEETDCGALTCDSGRCARAPDLDPPGEPQCIAE